ncbi:MAG TPA: hypothetical protein VGL08_13395 [Paraburkholderia sp.]|jgi:hypothetical protein
MVATVATFAHAKGSSVPHGTDGVHGAHNAYSATEAAPHTPTFDEAFRVGGLPVVAQHSGVQYAGAITPVSTESRAAPRPPVNGQSGHTGSIRDDVARYNEERVSRQIARPPGDAGRQQASPYRN